MLKKLAEATGGQDWDGIARELGTARTPHACFVRCLPPFFIVSDHLPLWMFEVIKNPNELCSEGT